MGDLISKQDVKWQIQEWINELNEAIDMLDSIPSAEPKTGEWIEVEVFPEAYDIEGIKTWASEMQCDQCGLRHTAIEGHMTQYNFCPNCGADMRKQKLQYGDEDTSQGGLMSAT